MSEQLTLAPIVVGYRFAFTLGFTGADGSPLSGFDLSTATRVMGQFRKSREDNGVPLATVDTQDGSLTIVNAHSLSFVLSKSPDNRHGSISLGSTPASGRIYRC
jgi:hypothetical protein